MAFRSDITVDWNPPDVPGADPDPRIIEVLAPATEITIQDLVDTLRFHEALLENESYPHLVNAAGKEDLGNNTFVGITVQLQNACIQFQARGGPDFEVAFIRGGNLTSVDEFGVPITAVVGTAFVTVVISQSASATIIDGDNAALWTAPIENGRTAEEMWRLMYAAMVNIVSGADSNTMRFRDDANTKDRITATVDAVGNRTAVVKDGS